MTHIHASSGFINGALLKGAPLFDVIDGDVYWVDSASGDASYPCTFTKPAATIDQAINKCTAGNNDHIFVKAGHAETINSATSLVCDIADVAIIGLGNGTDRPKLTFTTTTAATIPVSAANVMFRNIVFSANFADVAEVFTPTATNLQIVDCKFTQEAASMNFVELADLSTTDNQADGLTFVRCEWIEPDTATTSMINVDADIDRLVVHDCHIDLGVNGVLSAVAEVAAGKDTTNVSIRGNYISRLVAASAVQIITWVDTTTTNTGVIAFNALRTLDTGGELVCTAASEIAYYENYSSSVVAKPGYLLPAADS